jgi:hypothetical protein
MRNFDLVMSKQNCISGFTANIPALAGLLACLALLGALHGIGQTYTNQIGELSTGLQYPFSEYGGGVSFVDWNGDGLDDITIARKGASPLVYQNNGSGFTPVQPVNELVSGETKAVIWVDYDNDGDKDLFTTEYLGPPRLYKNTNGVLQNVTIEAGFSSTEYESFGASWGDFDRDGFLDVYLSNYNLDGGVENQCYHNNGNGTFTDFTAILGIGNGMQTTFCSLWWDYDRNGWPDLLVANDRDPFFNALYRNQDGTFAEMSESVNLYENIWSMSTSAADYDNDGDLDLYVSNAWVGHRLYNQNELGAFDNVAGVSGIYDLNFAWAAQWMDYNLDGWQDLYICYEPHSSLDGTNQMLVNNGEFFLYDNSMGLDALNTESHSSAIGDWNEDGVFDIFCYNEAPDLATLWTSSDVDGTYLKVGLTGTISNRDAIGSFITIWVNGEQQLRHTYCGEGYLTQNSSKEIFGLNGATNVDSLQVIWPSGLEEMLYDIPSNQCITVIEGLADGISMESPSDLFICGEGEAIFYLENFASYEWSDGSFGSSIVVDETLDVWVIGTNAGGQNFYSDTVSVVVYDEPTIGVNLTMPTCFGDEDGALSISNTLGTGMESVSWESGQDTTSILNLSSGWHHYTFVDDLGCVAQDSILLPEPPAMSVEVSPFDVSCNGFGDGGFTYEIISAQGGITELWELNPDSLDIGEHVLQFVDSAGCTFETEISISEPEVLGGAVQITQTETGFDCTYLSQGGTDPVTALWSNGETEINNLNLEEGDQWVTLTDSLGCEFLIDFTLIFIGVAELDREEAIVFPVPSNGNSLTIQYNGEFDQVQVRALSGALIETVVLQDATRETQVIFSNKLASGIYILEIISNKNQLWNGRFSVE